jgi:hypothetical protein
MKKIAIIALTIGMMVGCKKNSNSPNSAGPTTTPASKVWCIKSYTNTLECNKTSEESAVAKAQWYRDNGYTFMTVEEKSDCSECY